MFVNEELNIVLFACKYLLLLDITAQLFQVLEHGRLIVQNEDDVFPGLAEAALLVIVEMSIIRRDHAVIVVAVVAKRFQGVVQSVLNSTQRLCREFVHPTSGFRHNAAAGGPVDLVCKIFWRSILK